MRVRLVLLPAIAFTLFVGFANAAPAPEPPKPTAEELNGLFGKDHFSPELDAFRELVKEPPKAVYFKGGNKNRFNHDWESKGLRLHFDPDCRVEGISLYSGISTDPSGVALDNGMSHAPFQAYKGQLPFGLTFDDTPEMIQKKLGKPPAIVAGEPTTISEAAGDGNTSAYSYPYTKGLYIHFNDYGVPGPKSKIAFVIYFVPKVKEPPKQPAPAPGSPP